MHKDVESGNAGGRPADQTPTESPTIGTIGAVQTDSRPSGSRDAALTAQNTTINPSKAGDIPSKAPHGGLRKKLPLRKVEAIWALSGMGRQPNEIAQMLSVSSRVVKKYLQPRFFTRNPALYEELQTLRANVSRAFASRLAARGVNILDSISPKEVKALKPNARAVVAGIMIDKAAVLDNRADKLDPGSKPVEEIPSQRSVADLLASIKGRLRNLTILNIEVSPEILKRVEAVETEYLVVEHGGKDTGA